MTPTRFENAVATVLDAVAVLLVAAAVAFGLYRWIGWWSVAVAGLAVFAAVRASEAVARYRQAVKERER